MTDSNGNHTFSICSAEQEGRIPFEKEKGPPASVIMIISLDRGPDEVNSIITEVPHDETIGNNHEAERKSVSRFSSLVSLDRNDFPARHRNTFRLAYETMGVVYAGIGTCPLYVFSSIHLDAPSEQDYLGIFSIIFWTFTLTSLFKYAIIVLRADDHGEGGTFALYSLLSQHANISRHGSPVKKARTSTPKPGSLQSRTVKFLEGSIVAQRIVFIATIMGLCMLIGDGIVTPAISVLSAVQGLKTASSSLNQTTIMSITTALLIALFLLQRFGTRRVTFVFSPIVVVWFVSTAFIGAYNVVVHYPAVFRGLSPHYIATFFLRRGKEGWRILAATVLCITSSEAMFADLGHFNRISMQVAFAFVAYPSNVITYAGQTAYLIVHPENRGEVFYNFIPRPIFWPMFVIATLAAIVASQCLISATFSLVKQSVALDFFPKVRLIHTSKDHEGQVYSPEANYFLMVLCVLVVLGFRDAVALGNAYGVAVIMVMFITTCFVSLVMVVVWNTPLPLVLAFLLTFGTIEAIYISAVLSKVPHGGWLPFLVAIFLAVIICSWVYGRDKHRAFEKAQTISMEDLGILLTTSRIKRVPGLCIFYCELEDHIPPLLRHYLKIVRSLHQTMVFTSLTYVKVPKVPEAERFKFSSCGGYKGLYECVAFYGYAEEKTVEWSGFYKNLLESLKDYIESSNHVETATAKGDECPSEGNCKEDLAVVESAMKEGPVLVMGRTRLVTLKKAGRKNLIRKLVLDIIYQFLNSNSTSTAASLKLTVPPSNLMEISMLYEV